jgi:hypothetical protein
MKEAAILFSYVLSVGILTLAAYFAKSNSGSPVRRAMAFLSFSTGMWVLATTVGVYHTPDTITLWSAPLTYVFGVIVVTGLVIFSLEFPASSFGLDARHITFLFIPVAIFTYLLLATPLIIADYQAGPNVQGVWIGGPLYNLYNIYLTVFYIAALVILASKFSKVDGINRANLGIVFWAFLLGGSPAVVNDLIVPLFVNHASTPFIGTMSTIAWLGLTSYILVKK